MDCSAISISIRPDLAFSGSNERDHRRFTLTCLRPMLIAAVVALLRTWAARRRQRHALAELDVTHLADIGIPHDARARECRKWFWEQ